MKKPTPKQTAARKRNWTLRQIACMQSMVNDLHHVTGVRCSSLEMLIRLLGHLDDDVRNGKVTIV